MAAIIRIGPEQVFIQEDKSCQKEWKILPGTLTQPAAQIKKT